MYVAQIGDNKGGRGIRNPAGLFSPKPVQLSVRLDRAVRNVGSAVIKGSVSARLRRCLKIAANQIALTLLSRGIEG